MANSPDCSVVAVTFNNQPVTISQSKPILFFNSGTQITLKLSTSNYKAWCRQTCSLLSSMKLFGYADGYTPSQEPEITQDSATISNPEYKAWFCQDQLIVSLILSSINERDSIALSACQTSHQLWMDLESKYANPLHSHIMSLKNQLR